MGGSDARRDTPELRRDQQRLKFLLSRCRFSGSVTLGFPHLPRGSQFPPSAPRPKDYLKGPRGTFRASLYTFQTLVWQVLLINISIQEPEVPDCALRGEPSRSGSEIQANGDLPRFAPHPHLPCTFLQMEPPNQDFKNPPGPS